MSSRREEIEFNLHAIQGEIAPFNPTLIAVTKTYPISDVEILRELGIENFGENRSDEGVTKSAVIAGHWHYQGAVQSKKIREILSWAKTVHSLDDVGHAEKMERILIELDSSVDVFIQLSLDGDPTRGGVIEENLMKLAENTSVLTRLRIQGLMCVPPVDRDPKSAFEEIAQIHRRFIANFPDSPYLSAGMSGDYLIALNNGATHIRLGSKILGARHYD